MKKIAIIGAGEFQKPLIIKAKELGFETFVFAWRTGAEGERIADHFYPISVVNRDQILHECKKIRPQAVVTIASDIAIRTANYVAEQLGLVSNGEKTYRLMLDKQVMRDAMASAGIPQPGYCVVKDDYSASEVESLNAPYIVKPVDRTNARGISVVTENHSMMDAIGRAREYSYVGAAIIESRIKGREYSCDTLSFNGNHQIIAYTKVETKNFKPYKLMQPVHFAKEESDKITCLISRVLDTFEIKFGASHIEFIVDETGEPFILEISETTGSDYIGSDLIPLTTGFDYLKAVIEISLGCKPAEPVKKQLGSAEVRYIRSAEDIEVFSDVKKKTPRNILGASAANTSVALGDSYILFYPMMEMGGVLPLELAGGNDYFREYDEKHIRRLNSPATALWYALQAFPGKKLYLPDYYYPRMIKEARSAVDAEAICFYAINDHFEPAVLPPDDGVVLLVDFFGLMGQRVKQLAAQYKHVIIDNSFAFFSKPLLRQGAVNIYSCTTFFGVSDGAYLVGEQLPEIELEQDLSHVRSAFLLKAVEEGSNAAYNEKNANESAVSKQHLYMSELTARIMDSIPYAAIAARRKENYRILAEAFKDQMFRFTGTENAVPQCFPLRACAVIRNELNSRRIYVPQLWKRNEESEPASFERTAAEQLCPLPLDQRYGQVEMEYLIRIVRELIEKQ